LSNGWKEALKASLDQRMPWPLRPLYKSARKAYAKRRQKRFFRQIAVAERKKIEIIRNKERLRVVFIVIHQPTWKTDRLFRLMMEDPRFSPCILVAPDTSRPLDWSRMEMQRTARFFSERSYEVHLGSHDDAENPDIVKEIGPDVIFFNNPHGLTYQSLNLDLIESQLSCYIPYHIEIGKYNNGQDQYNRRFHNEVWRIFAPHKESKETFRDIQARKGANVVVTGYPGLEPLVAEDWNAADPWKPLGLKRIIWAPHHTIDMPSLPYANFLRYADHFRELVDDYADRVQWCFKPHPLLKPKLFEHPDWGPERTEAYYRFWENHSNTQLELGEYTSLFRNSDAMIHDSGSFLAEYLYVDKPVMYLWSSPRVVEYFNGFGIEALGACDRGDSESDIRRFIDSVLRGKDSCQVPRHDFLEKHPVSIDGELPSDRIVQEIKAAIWS